MTDQLQVERLLDVANPHEPAIISPERTLTWEQLEVRSIQLANALESSGVKAGEAWGVLAHNRAEWAEFSMGNSRAGTRIVFLNWHLTARELSELIIDSGAKVLVVDPGLRQLADDAISLAGDVSTVELGPEYEGWLADAPATPPSERQAGAPLLFTGGTTGRSKGVTRSDHKGNASDWAKIWSPWANAVSFPHEGATLASTPLYHALGMAGLVASMSRHVPVVVMTKFVPEEVLELIERHRITAAPMVPTQFIRLLKLDDHTKERYDLSSLQWVLHTAAPCPAWAKRAMIEWFGPVIVELYGSSEGTGPAICTSEEWLTHPGTVGRSVGVTTYTIVDDDGNDLPNGEVGTIYCKRAQGAPEYFGDPEKTASIQLPDGRFTVGDLGWLDDDGFLYLADRRVDLIITGGSNVYPAEIEAVLSQFPSVLDVAVFGIPDPEFGQQIKAVIEVDTRDEGDELDVDALREFASAQLASFKMPKSFDVVDELPREAHGKLKKRLLRDPYWE